MARNVSWDGQVGTAPPCVQDALDNVGINTVRRLANTVLEMPSIAGRKVEVPDGWTYWRGLTCCVFQGSEEEVLARIAAHKIHGS